MSEKVTQKSNKSIIWDAYKEKLEEIKRLKNETISEKRDNATISMANTVVKDYNIITKGLNTFLNDFNEKVNTLNDLDKAILIKSKEMKNLYDIEVEAASLEAVKLAINELDKERDSLENKLEEKEDEINDFYQENLQKAKSKLAQEMEVEKYNFERHSKIRNDQFEDEIKVRRKAFDEYVSGKKKEIENENKELDQRFKVIELREEDVNKFQDEIKDLKDQNLKIAEETKTETKKKADKEKEIALNIQKSKYESKIDHLNSIIDLKDNVIIDQKQNMTNLENKLDEAYKKVNELATNAVSSAKDKELTSHLAEALRSRNDNK